MMMVLMYLPCVPCVNEVPCADLPPLLSGPHPPLSLFFFQHTPPLEHNITSAFEQIGVLSILLGMFSTRCLHPLPCFLSLLHSFHTHSTTISIIVYYILCISYIKDISTLPLVFHLYYHSPLHDIAPTSILHLYITSFK